MAPYQLTRRAKPRARCKIGDARLSNPDSPPLGNKCQPCPQPQPPNPYPTMRTHTDPHAQSPKDLLDDLHTLVTEAEQVLSDSNSSHASETMIALRARLDSAQARLGELYSTAKQRTFAGAKFTDETIRANPYQSLAVVAGVGLLVGILIGRRKD